MLQSRSGSSAGVSKEMLQSRSRSSAGVSMIAKGFMDLKKSTEEFAHRNVIQEEQENYLDFMNLSTLKKRIAKSEEGYISHVFRVKQLGQDYKKKEITLMTIGDTRATQYLFCVKDYVESE